MRRIRFHSVRNPLRAVGAAAALTLLIAAGSGPGVAQDDDAAAEESAAEEEAAEASPEADAAASDEVAEESEPDPVIEATPQPILTEADFAAVPPALHPQLEALNAAVEQLSNSVRATQDPAALRSAAQSAATEIQAIRRALQFHGIRVEDRGGKLVDILQEPIGVEASTAVGSVIADALTIERGLRYCLELFPNTCHQQLRGDLRQLSQFDPNSDLDLPEGKKRIASTETLGLGALVVAYLPDPKAPVERKPQLTGDDEVDAQRRTEAMKSHQEAMEDFMQYRIQVQEARRPHTIVNHALVTGNLLDIITAEREFTNEKGEKEKVERDPTKKVRGPNDPSDDVDPEDLWALLVKLDQEDEAFRQSLVGASGAASTSTD